jgi:adenylate cyclase
MPELAALGEGASDRWQRLLPDEETVRIGRAPTNGWAVPWDPRISREHFDVTWDGDKLDVICFEAARNRIVYEGKNHTRVTITVDTEFHVGRTRFRLSRPELTSDTIDLLQEQAYAPVSLESYWFSVASRRLELLSKLPRLIAAIRNDDDLATRLSGFLLASIPRASVAAIVRCTAEDLAKNEITRMRWEGRDDFDGKFSPSRNLIKQVLARPESVLHLWLPGDTGNAQFTVSDDLDWAFCTPLPTQACKGWCFYLAGELSLSIKDEAARSAEFEDDVRFSELLADFASSIQQVRLLEHKQAEFSQFLSPTVVSTVTQEQFPMMSLLEPHESDVTVLFCDLKGFSRISEQGPGDLKGLLDRVSGALGVMTEAIFRQNGAVEDFRGDSVLGFWGWPFADTEGSIAACRATLDILHQFAQHAGERDSFRVGFGITHGPGIVGKIGTASQSKIGVFGPAVNLGSRIEGMTRRFGVPILIDDVCADDVREVIELRDGRLRRIAQKEWTASSRSTNCCLHSEINVTSPTTTSCDTKKPSTRSLPAIGKARFKFSIRN